MLLPYLQAHTTEHGELYFLVHQCGFIGILVSFLVGDPVMDHFQMWNNELQDQSPPLQWPLSINIRSKYHLFILNTT